MCPWANVLPHLLNDNHNKCHKTASKVNTYVLNTLPSNRVNVQRKFSIRDEGNDEDENYVNNSCIHGTGGSIE